MSLASIRAPARSIRAIGLCGLALVQVACKPPTFSVSADSSQPSSQASALSKDDATKLILATDAGSCVRNEVDVNINGVDPGSAQASEAEREIHAKIWNNPAFSIARSDPPDSYDITYHDVDGKAYSAHYREQVAMMGTLTMYLNRCLFIVQGINILDTKVDAPNKTAEVIYTIAYQPSLLTKMFGVEPFSNMNWTAIAPYTTAEQLRQLQHTAEFRYLDATGWQIAAPS